ncbi:MAG: hypothetical protein PHY43_02180 [Verrucomicrobiales bacterium]|nr:hypothetical protein [Verrucomicrobiales bacterium]
MSKDFNNQTLAVSQRLYCRLLLAYPKAHRADYGPAMAQLFRDQCRDAWNESRGWGVARLWLRVLPDLVNTSITERLAALNERKSMFDKMTILTQPRTAFFKVFVMVFLLILCTTVAVTFLLPETYASISCMKVESDEPVRGTPSNDPYFIQTTFEIMESQLVLEPVIEKLNLNSIWGKKYGYNEPLKTENTLEMLKKRIKLTPVRNTSLIEIAVYSNDKNEAAQIANAIAQSYQDYRVKYHATLTAKGLGVLQSEFRQEAEQIQTLQANLDSLRRDLKINYQDSLALTPSPTISPQEQPYWDKKRELAQLLQFHKLLAAHIEAEKIDEQIPNTSMAEIVTTAKPGNAPVRPNKALNITLGAIGGILLALVVGGIAALIAFLIRKRIRNISVTT